MALSMIRAKTIKSLKHIPNVNVNPLLDRLYLSMAIKSWVSYNKRLETKKKAYLNDSDHLSLSTLLTEDVEKQFNSSKSFIFN